MVPSLPCVLPKDKQAPEMNFLLADLLFDNHEYVAAAKEYTKTAYQYPPHKRSAEAAYAAVLAYREQIRKASEEDKPGAVYQAIASSIRFADAFPKHPEAAGALDQAAIRYLSAQGVPESSRACTTGRQGAPNRGC